ncbi:hypothetical protein Pelo_18700 [Pelomyxa schiedti]|nr:hypothetical protein Pelo_18700 [Pelomyxa schiedti]
MLLCGTPSLGRGFLCRDPAFPMVIWPCGHRGTQVKVRICMCTLTSFFHVLTVANTDGKVVVVSSHSPEVIVYSFPAMFPLFTLATTEFRGFTNSSVAWLGPNAFVCVRPGHLLLCTIPATPNTHNSPCPIQTEEGTAIFLSRKFDGAVQAQPTISPVHHQAAAPQRTHADAIAVLINQNSSTRRLPGELHLFTGLFEEQHCSHRILSRNASAVASAIGRIFAQIIQPNGAPQIVIFHSETGDPLSSLACPFSPPFEVLTVYSGTVLAGIQDGSKLVTWDLLTVNENNSTTKQYHKSYIQHPMQMIRRHRCASLATF